MSHPVTAVLLVLGFAVFASEAYGAAVPTAPAPAVPTEIRSRAVAVEGGSYTAVDAAGLASMLQSKNFLLINVHIPYEGEIDRTDLFIPYNEIEAQLPKLPADKGAKIVLYCRSGRMSDLATRALVKLGYTNVWHLDGGMINWEQAGYPLR